MKFNISKDDLQNALSYVSKGISTRSTLPILAGILIEARKEGDLLLQSTDLEISVRHTCLADVIEPGSTVVPGRLFMDIVKALPDAAIGISFVDAHLKIDCMGSIFSLSTLSPADFPFFPEVSARKSINLPMSSLQDAVHRVEKAVSKDESRIILTGILFSLEEGRLRLAATDSYRLAVADVFMQGDEEVEEFQAIIPGKTFDDVCRLAPADETLHVGFSDNQVVFRFGATTFITRIIEGKYPNYKQLIPSSNEVSVRVDTNILTTAIKRVSVLAQSHTPINFSFSEQDQELVVSAKSQEMGNARESIPVEMQGEDLQIAFNHQYALDGLLSIQGECVMEFQSSVKPGVFKAAEDDGFLYLAMPVRLK